MDDLDALWSGEQEASDDLDALWSGEHEASTVDAATAPAPTCTHQVNDYVGPRKPVYSAWARSHTPNMSPKQYDEQHEAALRAYTLARREWCAPYLELLRDLPYSEMTPLQLSVTLEARSLLTSGL
jgi:hypothetical protein